MKKILHYVSLILYLLLIGFSGLDSWSASRYRVSAILSYSNEPYHQLGDGFRKFFRGKNIDIQFSEYSLENYNRAEICEKIIKDKPDLIFAVGTNAAKLIKEKFLTTPVVFGMVLDPAPLIAENVSGVIMDIPVIKKLEMIKKIIPRAGKIGVLYSPESVSNYQVIAKISQQAGFRLFAKEILTESEIPGAIKEIFPQIDCFLMIPDSKIFFLKSIQDLLLESLRNKIAVVGLSSPFTRAGALFSLECDYTAAGQQAGQIAWKILQGTKPSEIPPEDPAKISLSLNTLVAERLGLEISPEIKKQAAKIFVEGE